MKYLYQSDFECVPMGSEGGYIFVLIVEGCRQEIQVLWSALVTHKHGAHNISKIKGGRGEIKG